MSETASRTLLITAFLAMLAAPPLLQAVVEVRRGEWPRAVEIFTQPPSPVNLRTFERSIEDSSATVRALRPWMQAAQFLWLGEPGEKAIGGRDGWLFYRPGVRFLTQRRAPGDSTADDALAAVLHFRDQLATRGIQLIVMPAPNKESVYPDQLACGTAPPTRIIGDETRAFLVQCEAHGVAVVDLFAIFREARASSVEPLYLQQDSHWSPAGMELAAAAVAERIRAIQGSSSATFLFGRRAAPVARLGDLVRMLRSPAIENRLRAEPSSTTQIIRNDTDALYVDDPASDVLVLGDSFLRIYQQDEPGGAGFVAHLAMALGRPVTSIVNDGGASTLIRQELSRRPQLLANKKVVVWEFVERDLRLGTEGWQLVNLPPL